MIAAQGHPYRAICARRCLVLVNVLGSARDWWSLLLISNWLTISIVTLSELMFIGGAVGLITSDASERLDPTRVILVWFEREDIGACGAWERWVARPLLKWLRVPSCSSMMRDRLCAFVLGLLSA